MNRNRVRRFRRSQRERLLLRMERAFNRLKSKGVPITQRTFAREAKVPLPVLRNSYPVIFERVKDEEAYEYKRRKEVYEQQLLLAVKQAASVIKSK